MGQLRPGRAGPVGLADKVAWLRRNDAAAQRIGRRGRGLAAALTYEPESERAMPVIAAAFRYFAGRPETVGPYGRSGTELPSG